MRNLIIGFILGVVVASVGFSGVARILDRSIDKTKEIAIETAK